MTRLSKAVLSMLLWTWGGTVYFILEVIYKSLTGNPEAISWTMLIVAVILSIPLERCGAELPWGMPLPLQAGLCSIIVVLTEFISGCIINIWLGMNVWDYSSLPGNVLGQICPQFAGLWFVLCLVFIPIFDWLRYFVTGGDKPTYRFI